MRAGIGSHRNARAIAKQQKRWRHNGKQNGERMARISVMVCARGAMANSVKMARKAANKRSAHQRKIDSSWRSWRRNQRNQGIISIGASMAAASGGISINGGAGEACSRIARRQHKLASAHQRAQKQRESGILKRISSNMA